MHLNAKALIILLALVIAAGCAGKVHRTAPVAANNYAAVHDIGMFVQGRNGELQVRSVVPGLPSQEAGLQARDVLLKVDGKKRTHKEFVDLVNAKQSGEHVLLVVQRKNDVMKFDIQPKETLTAPTVVAMRRIMSEEKRVKLAVITGTITNRMPVVSGSWEDIMRTSLQGSYEDRFLDLFGDDKGMVIVDRILIGTTILENKIISTGTVSDQARLRIRDISRATHILLVNFFRIPSGAQCLDRTEVTLIDAENGDVLANDRIETPACREEAAAP